MIDRIENLYQWLSPVCLSVAAGMVAVGGGALDSVVQGWTAAVYWGVCGGFAMSGVIFSLLGLYAAQQHVRVARARILRHRSQCAGRNHTTGRVSYAHLIKS